MKFLNSLKALLYKTKKASSFNNFLGTEDGKPKKLLNKKDMFKYKDNLFTLTTDKEIGGRSTANLEFSKEEGLKLTGLIDGKDYDKLEKYPFICLSYKV